MTEGWVYDVVIEKEKRRESFFSSLSSDRERKRKRKQKLSSSLETNQLDFFSLIAIHT
jgi:hypothetical protein